MKIDSQYPFFGLGALIITEEEYSKMDAAVTLLKKEFFADEGTFILHSAELKRPLHPKSDKRNMPMLEPEKRRAFFDAFDKKIMSINFHVIGCFIRKHAMVDTYSYPENPYYFSFENLLNRIIRYGGPLNHIRAEKRGPELDIELTSEYERLLKVGIHKYPADAVAARTTLTLINKKENVNGLQVIDLILSALTRSRTGKTEKMIGNDLSPQLIEAKCPCPLTIFPYNRKR